MQTAVFLVPLLLLGWVWTLQGVPVLPEPLFPTQESFDLDRFMGKWHDIAVASNCGGKRQHSGDSAIGSLELKRGSTEGKIEMKRSILRQGTCKEISGEYDLTETPGRLYYHVEKWGIDVDAYVVHTNYNEYAIIVMSKQKADTSKSISVKLYSRTMEVRPSVLEDFKILVGEQDITEDLIVIKKNKGECTPGEQVSEPEVEPEPQRARRSVVPTLPTDEEEGSGDTENFRGLESCRAQPDAGPCFGSIQRFYYNSSSMSCQTFNYGGCLGNQNNFVDERDCLQSCRTEAVCRLPMDAYPCTGQKSQVWAFDFNSGQCLPYKQDFCQANGNKFYSMAECQEYCGVVKDVADEGLLQTN